MPEHQNRPHIRNFQPLGVQQEGKTIVLLRDPSALSAESMGVIPQVLPLILQFQGRESLEEISERTKAPVEMLRQLVGRMDELGLLWGPRFEELERVAKAKVESAGHFPATCTQGLGDAAKAGETLGKFLSEAEDPEIDGRVVGLLAPHLDYQHGIVQYAAAYRALAPDQKPDRVVVLGTNHFGIGDGVVMSEFGFATPLGVVRPDKGVHAFLESNLGRKRLYADQMDFLGEHSVQLHLPWIQHMYGEIPVVAALVPDPMRPMVADDGARATTEEFVKAMRTALGELGGRTLFISSADLSHVGPQFGDPGAVNDQVAAQVEQLDRERLKTLCQADADRFEAPFRAQNNHSRWCSLGNIGATLRIATPSAIELIDYRQLRDTNGAALISTAAMALVA